MDTQTVAVALPGDVIYVSGTVNGTEYIWTNIDGNRWEAIVARTENEIYAVVLSLVNGLGETTSTSFTLYFGTLNLITDRSARDVERWRLLHSKGWSRMTEEERAEWKTALKGAYNATDMNRVESAVEFVASKLRELGYPVFPVAKTTWTVSDHPTKADMERYLGNIALIRSAFPVYPTTPKTPSIQRKMDYLVANDIEQILTDVDRLITGVKQSWCYAGDVFTGEI